MALNKKSKTKYPEILAQYTNTFYKMFSIFRLTTVRIRGDTPGNSWYLRF